MAARALAQDSTGTVIRWAVVTTTLGPMLVAASPKGLCRLAFNEGEADLLARFPQADLVSGGADFTTLLSDVVAAVETGGDSSHIPLDLHGTPFQQAVWRALRAIPSGETRSYAEIAAAVGKPGAVRACGSANGANAIAVLVPCHRVIRSDGGLGGYAWGLDIKQRLLAREGVVQSK
jgi:AraC family transcriptional regulator of adaptative response/methylated-DNA-[protein]-cysteine methyltransferase